MSWNAGLPQDSSKLRLSAAMIRSNWNQIQTGGVPYTKIQLSKQASDPTRQNNTGWLYGKNPGTGFTELFYEDDRNPSTVIQLTDDGAIGSATATLETQFITFNAGTTFLDKNKQVLGWLRVNSNGTAASTSGDMTCSKTGTGEYTITFNLATVSAYVAAVTIVDSGGSRRGCEVKSIVANSFKVEIYSQSTGSGVDEDFHVIVFGGR